MLKGIKLVHRKSHGRLVDEYGMNYYALFDLVLIWQCCLLDYELSDAHSSGSSGHESTDTEGETTNHFVYENPQRMISQPVNVKFCWG